MLVQIVSIIHLLVQHDVTCLMTAMVYQKISSIADHVLWEITITELKRIKLIASLMVTEDNSRELVYTASDKTRLVPSNDSMCPFFMKTLDDKSSIKAHTQKTHTIGH